MAELRALGARSVPVVSRGKDFVFAQVIKDVVDFLELQDDTKPVLTPEQLAQRYFKILDTALRITAQMPDDQLGNMLPNRPRSWLVLMHHVYQIPSSFMDMEDTGVPLGYQDMVAPPPPDMQTSQAVAAFGDSVRQRFHVWWDKAKDSNFMAEIEPYFGKTSRHEMLERTVWHSTQHVRQVASLLEQAGVTPDRPLTAEDIQGLPLTEKVWDET